jgi:hypothetical protein
MLILMSMLMSMLIDVININQHDTIDINQR